ncbi:MAG TPA: hypothetical protein DCP92_22635 [Nitrospiraceae bacterium]|nr:hypothetical protein [Nitrospiraceae bacterium]
MQIREDTVGCEIYIPYSKELYKVFLSCKSEIEKELGLAEAIVWQELPGKKASRIRAFNDFRFDDTETWPNTFAWLITTCSEFKKVFARDWTNWSQQQHLADPE